MLLLTSAALHAVKVLHSVRFTSLLVLIFAPSLMFNIGRSLVIAQDTLTWRPFDMEWLASWPAWVIRHVKPIDRSLVQPHIHHKHCIKQEE